MSGTDLSGRPPAKAPGAIDRVVRRLFGKQGTISAVDPIGDHFRLITLEGPALKGVAWTPGQKLQVAMAASFVARTYTPLDWDGEAGRARLLGYAHGGGPGSKWLLDVRPGDGPALCDGTAIEVDVGIRAAIDGAGCTGIAVGWRCRLDRDRCRLRG
jgi:hypothetical protein